MNYPEFFDAVPAIKLVDPLGEFLGAFNSGLVDINYLDCVKLSGHSCPTVASAYVMAKIALEALYGEDRAVRSEIKISMKDSKDEGVTGVIGNIISYIAGAGDNGGFKGIGAKFSRDNLLSFSNQTQELAVKLTRIDNGKSVEISCDTSKIPGSPEMMELMQKSLQGSATTQESELFQSLWQKRVMTLLTSQSVQQDAITIKN